MFITQSKCTSLEEKLLFPVLCCFSSSVGAQSCLSQPTQQIRLQGEQIPWNKRLLFYFVLLLTGKGSIFSLFVSSAFWCYWSGSPCKQHIQTFKAARTAASPSSLSPSSHDHWARNGKPMGCSSTASPHLTSLSQKRPFSMYNPMNESTFEAVHFLWTVWTQTRCRQSFSLLCLWQVLPYLCTLRCFQPQSLEPLQPSDASRVSAQPQPWAASRRAVLPCSAFWAPSKPSIWGLDQHCFSLLNGFCMLIILAFAA